jgi:hypothetical protein
MLINIVLSMIAIYLSLGLFVTAYIIYLICRVLKECKAIQEKK